MWSFLRANAWLAIVAGLFVAAFFYFVDPAPPKELTLATGPENGAYHAFGQRLAARLEQEGFKVHLRPSQGSVENLAWLAAEDNDVALALVQSGIVRDEHSPLRALGSLFYEPVWLFTRREAKPATLRDLRGRRIAVGVEGSGTLPVARRVLELNGLLTADAPAVEMHTIGGEAALAALHDQTIDAAFFVGAPQSRLIARLLEDPALDFHSLRRARAYQAYFPRLTTLVIGEGQLDLARDIPDSDRTMLSAVVTLVANERFHPGLTPLILEAAGELLRGGGRLEKPGEFPAARPADFPLLAEADHYHRNGPPFLMRFLPFWAATIAFRVVIISIPMVALLIPLVRMAPPLYRWRTRRRIFHWYSHLRELDGRIQSGEAQTSVEADLQKLEALEREILGVKVPLSYTDELYDLHLHIEWVMRRLEKLRDRDHESGAPG